MNSQGRDSKDISRRVSAQQDGSRKRTSAPRGPVQSHVGEECVNGSHNVEKDDREIVKDLRKEFNEIGRDIDTIPPYLMEHLIRERREKEHERREKEHERREKEILDAELTIADAKPRSLWERLGARAVNEIIYARSKAAYSFTPTVTKGCATPDDVVNWNFEVKKTQDSSTKSKLKLPCMEVFNIYSIGEDDMRFNFLTPFTLLVKECCNYLLKRNAINVGAQVTAKSEMYLPSGLRADCALLVEGGEVLMYFEAKSPRIYPRKLGKSTVHDPVDMAKWYRENEAPGMRLADHSPISQIYQYGCENKVKYLVLTTGLYTWFLIRDVDGNGNGILKFSQTFVADQCFESGKIEPSCSLAQAFLCFILMALNDSIREVSIPESAKGSFRVSASLKNQKKQQGKAHRKSRRGTKRNSSMRKKGGEVVDVLLPLDKVDFSFDPVESFHARYGVAHRMIVNDLDCVVKMVDANKDTEGLDSLKHEVPMYETVGDLCGDVLPHVVYGGRLSLGRAGLILSYEGKSLNKVGEYKTKQTYEKAKCALEKLHGIGVLHGDIALRNIVTNSNGDIKLIDLGNAYKIDETGSEPAIRMEMEELKEIFN